MFTCTHVYICIYIYTHTYAAAYVFMYLNMYTFTHLCVYKCIYIRDLFAFPVVPYKSHNHPPPPNMVVEPLQIHHPTKASTLEEHHAESGPDLV